MGGVGHGVGLLLLDRLGMSPTPLVRKLQAATRPSFSLLFSGLNKRSDFRYSSYIFPSKPFTSFVGLL